MVNEIPPFDEYEDRRGDFALGYDMCRDGDTLAVPEAHSPELIAGYVAAAVDQYDENLGDSHRR